MNTIKLGVGGLLEYNAEHSLLICRECQYAVQKSALESHLLRHKIYRGDRKQLLSAIAHLDLLEPHRVLLPAPGSPPIDALPILSGYRCTAEGCEHLTVSSKRMKRHWSESHNFDGYIDLMSTFARPAKLQTFFRGTKIRYFEVSPLTATLVSIDKDEYADADDSELHHNGHDEEGQDAVTVTPSRATASSAETPASSLSNAAHGCSPADFSLELLNYFHHFTTVTCFTLPSPGGSQAVQNYWQTHAVSQALQRRWLMCGLLAIAVFHLATVVDDTMAKQDHQKRLEQFSSDFSASLEQMTSRNLDLDPAEIEAKQIGEQIRSLLRCSQWTLIESTLKHELSDPDRLIETVSTIRGCMASESTYQSSDIQNNRPDDQDESFIHDVQSTINALHCRSGHKNASSHTAPSTLLSLLRTLPFRMAENFERPKSFRDFFTIMSAISKLVQSCELSFALHEAGAAWQAVTMWLASIPSHFDEMIYRNDPAALVVLAHWAVILVRRAESVGYWFLRGSAKMVVLQIARRLSNGNFAVSGLVECLLDIIDVED
ncbi:hypothetical protein ACLMJK_004586 [Lecanora helva]